MTEAELDPVIHSQARLRVVAALAQFAPGDRIAFTKLQQVLNMTPGNLSTHLRKLEDAGYVEAVKSFQGRTPVTHLSLTARGRLAFEDYAAALTKILGGSS
jgi:DNA-binding MarR family transcriptional regulator